MLGAAFYRRSIMAGLFKQKALSCSFCGKTDKQVGALVAGPKVFICDECIGACVAHLPLRSRLGALTAMVLPRRWWFRIAQSMAGAGSA
jgi:hypothetical protein